MDVSPVIAPEKLETTEVSDIEKRDLTQEVERIEGTVRLFDAAGHIREIPIPSKDPRDPLTWPLWKRAVVLLSVCVFGTAGFGVVQSTPLFFSELIPLYSRASRGKINAASVTHLASYPSLCMGLGNFLFVPLSMMLGRRSMFLLNNVIMFASIIWAAKCNDFRSHLAARCLQGLSCGVSDCLLPIMILDMTFLHRRGLWMSFYWASTAAASALLLVAVPFAVEHSAIPWRTNYWFWSGFAAFSLVLGVFCLPETFFPRAPSLIDGQMIITDQYGNVSILAVETAPHLIDGNGLIHSDAPRSFSYVQQLAPLTYQPNGFRRFYMTYVEMAISLLNPSIIWILILNSLLFAGLVSLSLTYATQLEHAPWKFSAAAVGTTQAGSFFGAMIALALSGTTVDKVSGFLTRRNGGIREPEHLLPNFLLPASLAFGGMVLYGIVASNPADYPNKGWIAVHVSFGMYYCGFVALSAITGVWIAEATPHWSGAALVLVCGGRNAISFASSSNFPAWIVSQGFRNAHVELGGSLLAVTVVGGIPLYIWNKKIRRAWTRRFKYDLR